MKVSPRGTSTFHILPPVKSTVFSALAPLLATLPAGKSGILQDTGPQSMLPIDCATGLGKHGRPLAYGDLKAPQKNDTQTHTHTL